MIERFTLLVQHSEPAAAADLLSTLALGTNFAIHCVYGWMFTDVFENLVFFKKLCYLQLPEYS